MVVLVEQSVMDDRILKDDKDFQRLQDKLSTFKEGNQLEKHFICTVSFVEIRLLLE